MDLQSLLSFAALDEYPWAATTAGLAVLVALAFIANWITRRVLIRGLRRMTARLTGGGENVFARHRVAERFANAVPAFVLQAGIGLVPHVPDAVVQVVRAGAHAFVFLTIVLGISAALDASNELYERRPDSHGKPIKGYLQLVKIVLFAICALLIVGTLLDRDIFTLLAGLGALAAVLMLVFQNTILSLVASIQVSSYDMIRLGDWIEMPALNADGDVIDISLHTVKVQNWDKTVTTIPTYRLVSDTFKNWRGMVEAGGRRIKRALLIDQASVHFLSEQERVSMRRFALIDRYMADKEREIEEWNQALADRGREAVNQRRVTNLGTFRAYVVQYLRSHPGIHQEMTLMVRQLSPTFTGLPLEIYCFTKDTSWVEYEGVQSDIFDHLLAILPEFDLRLLQYGTEPTVAALDSSLVGAAP